MQVDPVVPMGSPTELLQALLAPERQSGHNLSHMSCILSYTALVKLCKVMRLKPPDIEPQDFKLCGVRFWAVRKRLELF